MSHIALSKKERINIYLKEYYFRPKAFVRYLRMLGGPIIFLISLYNYYYSSNELVSSLSGFTIVYGLYYTLKPLIIILAKPQLFQAYNFDFNTTKTAFNLQEDDNTSTLQHSFFTSVRRWKTFYALRTDKNQVLHLPINQLNDSEKAQLDKLITTGS